MVTPHANTGKLKTKRNVVIFIHQLNKPVNNQSIDSFRVSPPVVKKLILLETELTPETCREIKAKSAL